MHNVALTHVSLLSAQFRSPSPIHRPRCVILLTVSVVKQNSLQVTRAQCRTVTANRSSGAVLARTAQPFCCLPFPLPSVHLQVSGRIHFADPPNPFCLLVLPEDSRHSIVILSVKQLLFCRSCGRYSSSHEAAGQI